MSWQTPPLGSLVETIVPARDKPKELAGPIPWIRIEDFDGKYLHKSKTGQGVTNETVLSMPLRVFPTGTVVCSCSCSMGTTAIVRKPLVTNQTFIGLVPRSGDLDSGFLYYALQGHRERLTATATGAIQSYLSREDFRALRIPIPDAPTQRAIAGYLDRETERIDSLVTAKRRMVRVFEDHMRLTVYEQTTGSGDRIALRRLLRVIKTGSTPPSSEMDDLRDGDLPWYSPADVGEWLQLSVPERTLRSTALADRFVPEFPAESTLLVGIGATAGKVAYLKQAATGNQQLTCLVAGPRINPRFLAWQLFGRQDELRATAPFTTLPILNNEFVRSLTMVVPSLDEQARIAERLDAEAARTSTLTELERRQIRLLKEHRQALITAAVTGRLDIPEAA